MKKSSVILVCLIVPVISKAGRAETFNSAIVSTIQVAMRDGVKLSTDVYRPAVDEKEVQRKFPVLVTRTPYGKSGERQLGNFFAEHGYVFVAQDVRGRYPSEGHLYPLRDEGPDGYDTIQWAASQPWSNGKVGTLGASYLGMDQYGAALLKPPALVAMYVAVAGFSYYKDAAYRGGVRGTGWPVWLLFSASTSHNADTGPKMKEQLSAVVKSPENWLMQSPAERQTLFAGFPDQLAVYRDFYAHPLFDSYWKQPGLDPGGYLRDMKDVPIIMIGGWYDPFTDSMLSTFPKLVELQKTEKKILIGPWPHPYGKPTCGQASFGEQAHFDEKSLQLDWFDHWMKGEPFKIVDNNPVKYFRMGGSSGRANDVSHVSPGGSWQTAHSWPPAGTVKRKLYMGVEGFLGTAPSRSARPTTYTFDPLHPRPTLGGRHGPTCIQNQIVKRPDVISFLSDPLKSPLNVTGTIDLWLWASSNREDPDFTATLIDVYPDGYAMNLAEGQIRASYRDGNQKLEPLKPEKIYRFNIDLGSTSNLFESGHRIRLDISSSSFPKLEPNSGVASVSSNRRLRATNTLYHDAQHPSYLELSVLPN
jgi:putative CocE/NonD family hydrolase